jgi:hypothetical protein
MGMDALEGLEDNRIRAELNYLETEEANLREILGLKDAKIQEMKEKITELRGKVSRQAEQGLDPGDTRDPPEVQYAKLRMKLSCPLCERPAQIYVGGCAHLICGKCMEKARKAKNHECPICHIRTSEFVTIKWS